MSRFKANIISSLLIAFAIVLPLSIPALANGANLPDISNFGRISDHYYRGGQPEGKQYEDLAAFGIRTVINLTSDDAQQGEKSSVENAGMKYIQIPMTTHVEPTPAQIEEFLKIVNDPVNQPVFVHCVGGKHRTGVMSAVYRMTQEGWTADQAYKEMKHFKFGPSLFHPEFKKFVYDFHEGLVVERAKSQQDTATTVTAQ